MSHAKSNALTRRDLLKLGGMTAGMATAPAIISCSRHAKMPQNIILMVSDGMSASVPQLADAFSLTVRGSDTNWKKLLLNPAVTQGSFDMGSLQSMVTDSGAAITSWSSGSRVNNRALNTLPDGTQLKPIGKIAKEQGHKVGLVTTTRLTHATPAGFIASVPVRDYEDEIAEQFIGYTDIMLGGGAYFFDKDYRNDFRDLFDLYRKANYKVIFTREELHSETTKNYPGPILGTFDADHLPFTLDWKHDPEKQKRIPTLAEMTFQALHHLKDQPFLLQVEGGRVDHAAHANDFAGILWDQLAFDDALGEVLKFAHERDDTLVIVTTDHGNSNPGLNGFGYGYSESTHYFEKVKKVKATSSFINEKAKEILYHQSSVTPQQIINIIKENTSFELTEKEAEALIESLPKVLPPKPLDWNEQHRNFGGLLGQMLGNHLGVQWTGISHTSDWVQSLAMGPGSAALHGHRLNTDLFPILTNFLGSSHRNPSFPS